MKLANITLLLSVIILLGGCSTSFDERHRDNTKEHYILYPIGRVIKEEDRTFIKIDKEYQTGLMGLEKISDITIVYWFDKNDTPEKRSILKVHPQGDIRNPIRGVFATHSPVRPNLIAISRCKIISIKENVIEIDEIDAFHNSPVLDLKS